jgi:hypothetical protein
MIKLDRLAKLHQASGATPKATADFISNFLRLHYFTPAPLAQDAFPLSLKGRTAMPGRRASARDQGGMWERNQGGSNEGVRPDQFLDGGSCFSGNLGTDPSDLIQGNDQDPNGGLDPETACNFVRLMKNRFQANDAEGESDTCTRSRRIAPRRILPFHRPRLGPSPGARSKPNRLVSITFTGQRHRVVWLGEHGKRHRQGQCAGQSDQPIWIRSKMGEANGAYSPDR